MILRLLVLIGLVGLAYFLIRRYLTSQATTKKDPESFQPMVRCEHCGLHLPQQEAIPGPGDTHFCSREHAKAQD